MTITGQTALSADEIQRMVRDAEAHAEEDRRRREEAEVRNTADSLVYQTEKLLRDQGDRVPVGDRDQLETAIRTLKEALDGSDLDAIRSGTETLATAGQAVTQRLYEQAAGATGAAAAGDGAGGPDDDDIVDAEIVDERRSA